MGMQDLMQVMEQVKAGIAQMPAVKTGLKRMQIAREEGIACVQKEKSQREPRQAWDVI